MAPVEYGPTQMVGFNGSVRQGLRILPDGQHALLPVGTSLHLIDLSSPSQPLIMNGHVYPITAVAASPCGRWAATGSCAQLPHPSELIIWDLETLAPIHESSIHRSPVDSVCFSFDSTTVAAASGRDDGQVILYELNTSTDGTTTTAAPVAQAKMVFRTAPMISAFNNSLHFVTGADDLRIWTWSAAARSLTNEKVNLLSTIREVTSLAVALDDSVGYAGTQTGDIIVFSSLPGRPPRMLTQLLPPKTVARTATRRTTSGLADGARGPVLALSVLDDGYLLAGIGQVADAHGSVTLLAPNQSPHPVRATRVRGAVTSVGAVAGAAVAGTDEGNIYTLEVGTLAATLHATAHQLPVSKVFFAKNFSAVVASAAGSTIRVWSTSSHSELLRTLVRGATVTCACFSPDGKALISGWSDGKVRAFGPESGRLLYVIENAHQGAVTALTVTPDARKLVTGGVDGAVRIWRLGPESQSLLHSISEQTKAICALRMTSDGAELLSASVDGSVCVYDLAETPSRLLMLQSPSHSAFTDAVYHPDESQIVTVGRDGMVTWWNAISGDRVREIAGCEDCEISAIDISADGQHVLLACADGALRIMHYEEGILRAVGLGHGERIASVAVSPDMSVVVTGSTDGAVGFWKYPVERSKPIVIA